MLLTSGNRKAGPPDAEITQFDWNAGLSGAISPTNVKMGNLAGGLAALACVGR
jgi:hypothetical protein